MTFVVEQVDPSRTYPLRRKVLRPHQSEAEMAFPGEKAALSAAFAALDPATGVVVSTAAVQPEDPPWQPGSPTYEAHRGHAPFEVPEATREAAEAGVGEASIWRLRGMASEEGLRGQGLGRMVLDAAIAYIARKGGGLLWCNARIRAIPFYERAGFSGLGELFDEPLIGQHLVMWRAVEPAPGEQGS